ncbi:MAG: flavodoxin [Firmicutes bacterium]|nr:flavodoxin [Bacillota bacterium]
MSKIAIIYASTTGNTEAMAQAVKEGASGDVSIFEASSFDASTIGEYDSIALGSPAMGAEELEDSVEELYNNIEGSLKGKNVSIFGSYDWGDGQWLRDWEDRLTNAGANVKQSLAVQNTPDDDGLAKCRDFGSKL